MYNKSLRALVEEHVCVTMLFKPLQYLLAPLSLSSIAAAGGSCPAAGQPLIDLNTAANNSYFVKWRPGYHMGAPNSWQNGIECRVLPVLSERSQYWIL